MKRGSAIAVAIGVLFAWAGMAQEHAGPPGRTPEEECARSCHVIGCDAWVACIGTADTTLCQRNVIQKEIECTKKCEPPRG